MGSTDIYRLPRTCNQGVNHHLVTFPLVPLPSQTRFLLQPWSALVEPERIAPERKVYPMSSYTPFPPASDHGVAEQHVHLGDSVPTYRPWEVGQMRSIRRVPAVSCGPGLCAGSQGDTVHGPSHTALESPAVLTLITPALMCRQVVLTAGTQTSSSQSSPGVWRAIPHQQQ